MSYNNEERIGVNAIAKIITEDFGWIFREQPVNDFGIDATVEITKYSISTRKLKPTGKLIGLQIKSGKSYLKNETGDHYTFRASRKHVNYWLGYSIAVIVIIYDKTKNTAYWQVVNSETIVTTRNSFFIYILKNKLLNHKYKQHLINLGHFKNQHQYKLWQLTTSYNEVNLVITKRTFLYVEIDNVPHTNSYDVRLVLTSEQADDYIILVCPYEFENTFEYIIQILDSKSLKEAINDVLPWADLHINGVTFSDDILKNEIEVDLSNYDSRLCYDEILNLKNKSTLLEFACYFSGMYHFRLELSPNELANCFIKINNFLDKDVYTQQNLYI